MSNPVADVRAFSSKGPGCASLPSPPSIGIISSISTKGITATLFSQLCLVGVFSRIFESHNALRINNVSNGQGRESRAHLLLTS